MDRNQTQHNRRIQMKTSLIALISLVFNLTFQNVAIAQENDFQPDVLYNIGGFPSGTLVHTPDGLIPIQRLQVGGSVLSFDLETGNVSVSRIENLYSYRTSGAHEIVIEGESYTLNPDHRFYLPSSKTWVEAKNLKQGDRVLDKDGHEVPINSSVEVRSNALMYELTVERNSNYFVGNRGILVHNFAFVIPVATWVIGEGIVWATGWTIAIVAGTYLIMNAQKPSSKYCDGGDNIDLSKFKPGKKDGKNVLLEPKSGHYLDVDTNVVPHGGSKWKLKDQFGNRIKTITCDGKILRD